MAETIIAGDDEAERQAALAFDLLRLEPGFLEDPFPTYTGCGGGIRCTAAPTAPIS